MKLDSPAYIAVEGTKAAKTTNVLHALFCEFGEAILATDPQQCFTVHQPFNFDVGVFATSRSAYH